MKLREYIKKLQELVDDNPLASEFDLVHSYEEADEEFFMFDVNPELGFYDADSFDFQVSECDSDPVNSVCVS